MNIKILLPIILTLFLVLNSGSVIAPYQGCEDEDLGCCLDFPIGWCDSNEIACVTCGGTWNLCYWYEEQGCDGIYDCCKMGNKMGT